MTFSCVFEIKDGELIVTSTLTEEVLWKGKPKGYHVAQVLPIEGSNDCIVLLEWLKSGLENQKNLIRLDPYGNIVWEVGDPPKKAAPGPERGLEIESYTGITGIEKIQLIAFAYSGFSDHIDIETGAIIKSEFVK